MSLTVFAPQNCIGNYKRHGKNRVPIRISCVYAANNLGLDIVPIEVDADCVPEGAATGAINPSSSIVWWIKRKRQCTNDRNFDNLPPSWFKVAIDVVRIKSKGRSLAKKIRLLSATTHAKLLAVFAAAQPALSRTTSKPVIRVFRLIESAIDQGLLPELWLDQELIKKALVALNRTHTHGDVTTGGGVQVPLVMSGIHSKDEVNEVKVAAADAQDVLPVGSPRPALVVRAGPLDVTTVVYDHLAAFERRSLDMTLPIRDVAKLFTTMSNVVASDEGLRRKYNTVLSDQAQCSAAVLSSAIVASAMRYIDGIHTRTAIAMKKRHLEYARDRSIDVQFNGVRACSGLKSDIGLMILPPTMVERIDKTSPRKKKKKKSKSRGVTRYRLDLVEATTTTTPKTEPGPRPAKRQRTRTDKDVIRTLAARVVEQNMLIRQLLARDFSGTSYNLT